MRSSKPGPTNREAHRLWPSSRKKSVTESYGQGIKLPHEVESSLFLQALKQSMDITRIQ